MRKKTLSIQCNTCGNEVFLYVKFGKGHLIRCWKNRIIKDNSIKDGKHVKCQCGNIIGIDNSVFIKIKKQYINIK